MRNETTTAILDYAEAHKHLSVEDLFANIHARIGIKRSSLLWYLFKLVEDKSLVRTARGVYAKAETKQGFAPQPIAEVKKVYSLLKANFPFAKLCVYQGDIISPLQHHLSSNRVVYVETERDAAETVFHFLREHGKEAYFRPDQKMIYRYVDMNSRVVFVKNLVTEAPLQNVDDMPMPTLEKLLVDILRDADFFYLQGSESERIIDNAFSLYSVNTSRLFRYAQRRKVKAELSSIINNLHSND